MVHGATNLYDMKEKYYKEVMAHIEELMKEYPWTEFTILPTAEATPIRIKTIAVNGTLIEQTLATRYDFIGVFSKELELIVPFDSDKPQLKGEYGNKRWE